MRQGKRMTGRWERWRSFLSLALCLGAGVFLAPQAKAGFIESYPLTVFTLTDSPNAQLTNGSAMMEANTIVLTGGNSGSGEPGTTDLLTTALMADTIQFMYSYSSMDVPGADSAGYLLNGAFIQLATADGASGTVQFNVTSGETFGFRVATTDNEFEPGILTISDVGASGVPEPATGTLLLLVSVALLGIGWLRTSQVEKGA